MSAWTARHQDKNQGIFIIAILALALFAWTPGSWADGKASSSSSSNSKSPASSNVLIEVSGGTSALNQYLANDNIEHPLAYHVAARWHKSAFHLGFSYLSLNHSDTNGASPVGVTPNPNEVDATETFSLASLNAGLLLGNWLLLDAGYGYANFARKQSTPNSTLTNSQSYTATGTGWMVGGSLIPIHVDRLSLGVSGYYFDATATNYNSDVVNNNVETITTGGGSRVHSYGWYGGISIFVGI